MSKRQATSELNHENWDQDESKEDESMGSFKAAPKDVLQKRVIKTARRRNLNSGEVGKSVFESFGGFNKAQPSSFEFLANLTNGGNSMTSTPVPLTTKISDSGTSSLFNGKSSGNSTGTSTNLFSISKSPQVLTKSGQDASITTPAIFGIPSSSASIATTSIFGSSNSKPLADTSLFKTQHISSSPKLINKPDNVSTVSTSPQSSVFGITGNVNKIGTGSLFGASVETPFTTSVTTPFTTSVTTPFTTSVTSTFSTSSTPSFNTTIAPPFSTSVKPSFNISASPSSSTSALPLFSTSVTPSFSIQSDANAFKTASSTFESNSRAKTGSPVNTESKVYTKSTVNTDSTVNTNQETIKSNRLKFYSKLKALNDAVLEWIKKNIEETPICILTPIFRDYEKHLKEIQGQDEDLAHEIESKFEELSSEKTANKVVVEKSKGTSPLIKGSPVVTTAATSSVELMSAENKSGLFKSLNNNKNVNNTTKAPTTTFSFGITSSAETKSLNGTNFSFGSNNISQNVITTTPSFSFGNGKSSSQNIVTTAIPSFSFKDGNSSQNVITTLAPSSLLASNNASQSVVTTAVPSFFGSNSTLSNVTTGAPSFSFGMNKSPPNSTTTSAQFTFGTGKPFSFNSNIEKKPDEKKDVKDDQNENDEPPKVEFTPIVEENSVYERRCKIFVKKDDIYIDKGLGTLYIKKIEETGKYQLIVRANTNLGTILINLILVKAIPTQRLGKNNVMIVCIPTPNADSKQPTPVLIRVKTSEEADELLEILNKYKS